RDLERGEIALEGLHRLLDATFVERSNFTEQSKLLVWIFFVTELHLDRVGELLLVVGRLVERDEGFGGAEVRVIELEDLLVGLRGAIGLLLLVSPELGDLEEHPDLGFGARLLSFRLL